jgi:hypothetical protein
MSGFAGYREKPCSAQLMWRQPPRLSAERSDARVERTLLSLAFDVDVDLALGLVIPTGAGATATAQWRNLLSACKRLHSCGDSRLGCQRSAATPESTRGANSAAEWARLSDIIPPARCFPPKRASTLRSGEFSLCVRYRFSAIASHD